jgi:hypothetical protein
MTALAGLVLVSGCAVGGSTQVEAPSREPRADLARKAAVAAGNRAASPERDAGRAGRRAHEPADKSRSARAGSADVVDTAAAAAPRKAGPSSSPETGRWSALASIDDPVGDQGLGPGYADLSGVRFAERDGRLAISVTVASDVPATLADREVQGVGIDVFRSSTSESDYQVFLDGGRHGWRAFLQTPDGFVAFPGSFGLDGRTFSVSLPWSAIGGRQQAQVSVFADWSAAGGRSSSDSTSRVGLPGS